MRNKISRQSKTNPTYIYAIHDKLKPYLVYSVHLNVPKAAIGIFTEWNLIVQNTVWYEPVSRWRGIGLKSCNNGRLYLDSGNNGIGGSEQDM